MPFLSIVIPAYNRAHTISSTIESFLTQEYKEWEMIVVDDHSKDDTRQVIEAFCKKDSRIRYMVNERKKGAQGARNTGILHASAEWIVIFDSDDNAHSDFLGKLVDGIQNDIDVVSCDLNAVHTDINKIDVMEGGGDGYIERLLMSHQKYIYFDVGVIRKSKLYEIELLDEDCPAYQEFDTHLRLSAICKYKWVKEALVDWFVGGIDTITSKKKLNRNARCYVVWHNRKRWRELEYNAFIHEVLSLFAHSSLKARWLLIKAAPEILLFWPAVYINIVIRLINRKCDTQIPLI